MSVTAEAVQDPIECSICGLAGGPVPACEMCRGTAASQPRAYTLSEERQGMKNDPDRYSRTGDVSPKAVMVPGSHDPSKNQ